MRLFIRISEEPIPASGLAPEGGPGAGALAEFRGLVRGEEAGRPIGALIYEAYQPMAERQIERILDELSVRHPCVAVNVRHRTGLIRVGECAVYVGVAARHRAEAFALLAAFMNRLKQDVPIWKTDALPADSVA